MEMLVIETRLKASIQCFCFSVDIACVLDIKPMADDACLEFELWGCSVSTFALKW